MFFGLTAVLVLEDCFKNLQRMCLKLEWIGKPFPIKILFTVVDVCCLAVNHEPLLDTQQQQWPGWHTQIRCYLSQLAWHNFTTAQATSFQWKQRNKKWKKGLACLDWILSLKLCIKTIQIIANICIESNTIVIFLAQNELEMSKVVDNHHPSVVIGLFPDLKFVW